MCFEFSLSYRVYFGNQHAFSLSLFTSLYCSSLLPYIVSLQTSLPVMMWWRGNSYTLPTLYDFSWKLGPLIGMWTILDPITPLDKILHQHPWDHTSPKIIPSRSFIQWASSSTFNIYFHACNYHFLLKTNLWCSTKPVIWYSFHEW